MGEWSRGRSWAHMKIRSHLPMVDWLFLLLIRAWIRLGLGPSSFLPRDRGCQKYSHESKSYSNAKFYKIKISAKKKKKSTPITEFSPQISKPCISGWVAARRLRTGYTRLPRGSPWAGVSPGPAAARRRLEPPALGAGGELREALG